MTCESEGEEFDELDTRFLEVCIDGDVEELIQLFEEIARAGETLEPNDLNCVDNSGRTSVSHLCGNGMIEMLEVLEDVPHLDYNIPDNEGYAPLHYAAQAGHVEVVSFLLNKVRTIQVDPCNHQGFTPLMKAALQGRIKCSKLLLFSGASPARRDFGRGYNAAQWARYCGRHMCAESIEKFVRTAVQHGGQHGGGVVGGGLISFSSDSQQSLKVKKSKKNNGESRIRSRSTGSAGKSSSWLSRTLRKAFHHGSKDNSDHCHVSSEFESPGHFEKRGRSLKFGRRRSGSSKKVTVPAVHVTLTSADDQEDEDSSSPETCPLSPPTSGEQRKLDSMSDSEMLNKRHYHTPKKKFLGKKW